MPVKLALWRRVLEQRGTTLGGEDDGLHSGMHLAPRLHTDRLILRGHQESDLDDCAALWSNPDVTRYTTGAPLARQELWGTFTSPITLGGMNRAVDMLHWKRT